MREPAPGDIVRVLQWPYEGQRARVSEVVDGGFWLRIFGQTHHCFVSKVEIEEETNHVNVS